MKYNKVSVVKKIMLLLMTMALAVAMVACQAAAPGEAGEPGEAGQPGEAGAPGEAGEPGGVPPRIDEPIPDLQLAASGEMATHTIDLNDHFFDPDGDEGEALIFDASSADTEVVTAEVSGNTLTLEAAAVGTARITVRATDVDGLTSGADRFNVTVAVTVAPMVTPIPDTMLYQDDGPKTIALSEHFSHKNTITYRVVSALPAGHVKAEIAEGTLTLTPQARGQAIVVVEATADDKSISDEFMVDVESGSTPPPPTVPTVPTVAPTVTAEIGDMMLYLLDDAESIDLSEHFAHADEITYTATVRGSAVDTEVSGSTLTVTPVLTGDSRVTVKAMVGDKSIANSFMVNVKPGSTPVIPKVAPTKEKPIIAPMIYQGDGPEMIDLSEHFSHENEITYEAAVRGDAVDATTAGSILTLDPVLPGSARVTVTATADGKSSSYAFMVTVKAGTEPPPPPPEAIDAQGEISDVTVEVDKTTTVNVADKFTFTESVSYEVDESNANATATVDASGMVSITGKKVGQVTLTVTATDARDNEATQTIAVTVTAKSAPLKPSKVTILGVGMSEDISVGADQTVSSLDPAVVRAAPKSDSSTVWTLTGMKKGKAMVRVWNADREIDVTIAVTVANTPPKKSSSAPTIIVPTTDGTTDGGVHQHVDAKGNVSPAPEGQTPPATGADMRLYHKVLFDFSAYFEDADGSGLTDIDDKTGYMARSNEPYVDIVKVLKNGVVIDVKKDVGSVFPLVIYVVDKDGAMSEEVTISANSPTPLADTYEVRQDQGDGNFGVATVHLRQGVNHTLTFGVFGVDRSANDNLDGFNFIHVFEADQLAGYMIQGSPVAQADLTMVPSGGLPSATADTEPDPAAYLAVAKTGPVGITGGNRGLAIEADNVPTLTFSVTDSGSARVTVTYHRLVGKDGDDTNDAIDAAERKWMSDPETLTMTIR